MFSVALAFMAASVAEQMAPAQQGMLQCQMPDVLFKTCLSLSKVRRNGAGYILTTELVVIPPVTASVQENVFVRGTSICDVVNFQELNGARFASGGHPISAAQAAKYRALMKRVWAPLAGRTTCTTIVPGDGGMMKVIGVIDGKRFPASDYSMKWVAPEDGWTVAR